MPLLTTDQNGYIVKNASEYDVAYSNALDAAYGIGVRAYGLSPKVMPRRFEFQGRVWQWQKWTSCLVANEFRRGYRAARGIGGRGKGDWGHNSDSQ